MKKQYIFLVLSILLFFIVVFYFYSQKEYSNYDNCSYAYVEKIYDGDTVKTDKLGKIRLLGIDAPEIYHPGWTKVKSYKFFGCGKKAKEIAEDKLYHKKILFCKGTLSKNKGNYGRNLRYAMIKSGDILIPFGKYLLRSGYAKVYKYANFQYKKEYLDIEKYNKKNKIGVWSEKCIKEDKELKKKYLK